MKHLIKTLALVLSIAVTMLGVQGVHAEGVATLRGDAALNEEGKAPRMTKVENEDIKRKRDYPMQPPTIPHKIDNYQVDLNVNKCLSCHSRDRAEESQAPMISVTHFMNREGNFLADVSPRRYFCGQCHVTQQDTKPLVENEFKDVKELIKPGS